MRAIAEVRVKHSPPLGSTVCGEFLPRVNSACLLVPPRVHHITAFFYLANIVADFVGSKHFVLLFVETPRLGASRMQASP